MSQFHYGSITTLYWAQSLYSRWFVSIPLWFDYNKKQRANRPLFFCFVSIPLWFDYNVRNSKTEMSWLLYRLNSTMVRLQHMPLKRVITLPGVSIPLWFDYNKEYCDYKFCEVCVSIPLWFDYNKQQLNRWTLAKDWVSIPLWFDYNQSTKTYVYELYKLWSQFHYGSITTATFSSWQIKSRKYGLNSTMVRLQPAR